MKRHPNSEKEPESGTEDSYWSRLASQQFIAIFLAVLVVTSVGAMSIPALINSNSGLVAAQTEEGFDDDFEGYEANTTPDTWQDISDTVAEHNVTDQMAFEGSQSLEVPANLDVAPSEQPYNGTTANISAAIYSAAGSGETVIRSSTEDGNRQIIVGVFEGDLQAYTGSWTTLDSNINNEEWVHISITEIDTTDNTYTVSWEGNQSSGTQSNLGTGSALPSSGYQTVGFFSDGGTGYLDNYVIGGGSPPEITGQVADQNGDPINGATVEFRNVKTDSVTTAQTGQSGSFSISVDSGRYEITISALGYQTVTVTRDVERGDDLGTFQLAPQQLDLQFNRFMEPGDSTSYTVEFTYDNGTAVDVTENVTLNSSNTSIATLDTDTNEIIGQPGVNGTSQIAANYTVNNETYTAIRNITVATKTVDNLEIIPGTWRFSALMDDITIQVILVAIGAAIVATRAASSWAGLGAMELVMIIGWFGGWVPLGIMLLGLFTALFIGLNLAANIDYSVRR